MAGHTFAGRLLVASPDIGDPNFDRAVILLIDDSDDGAVGVVLNRPSSIELREALPEWETVASAPSVVFSGGPVSQGVALGLAHLDPTNPPDDWTPIGERFGLIDLRAAPSAIGGELLGLRIFSGYAGWGAGQLEGELDAGAWLVVDAVPDEILGADPWSLWGAALKRCPTSEVMGAGDPPAWLN